MTPRADSHSRSQTNRKPDHPTKNAHSTFYNKVKSLIGITPVEFIREIRLKRGHELLTSGTYDVSTVSYMVGFSDPRYFSKCFKKRFGVSPSQLKKHSL